MLTNVSVAVVPDLPGKICITCFFVLGVKDKYCSVNLKHDDGHSQTFIVSQQENITHGTICIAGLETGIYSILVCNADCDVKSTSQVTFFYNNLSISGVGMFDSNS